MPTRPSAAGTPLISFIGNVVDDRVAELAVEKLQLPYGDVASVEWGESIAARIRARGVSTFIDAVSKDPRILPTTVKPEFQNGVHNCTLRWNGLSIRPSLSAIGEDIGAKSASDKSPAATFCNGCAHLASLRELICYSGTVSRTF